MTAELPLLPTTASFPARMGAVVAGAAAMALASQVAIPMPPVPLTLQTYAVFVLSALLGGSLTLRAVLIWLAVGAVGLPVFADGGSGPGALFGAGQGYLFGMAVAGALAGYALQRRSAGFVALVVTFLAGHALVLAMGWMGLLDRMDPGPAFAAGVTPYLPGAVFKSLAAAATVHAVKLALGRRAGLEAGE